MRRRLIRLVIAGTALLAASGCTLSELGDAAIYNPNFEAPITVIMDPRAPSISQQFRVSMKPVSDGGVSTMHEGIDIVASVGTPVIAAASGRVSKAFAEPAYGNQVVIDHGVDGTGRRTFTVYRHLAKRLVTGGRRVERGEQIGTMGRTGFLAGGISHLHFEVRREVKGLGVLAQDPHKFWALGIGRVTCFDPDVPSGTAGVSHHLSRAVPGHRPGRCRSVAEPVQHALRDRQQRQREKGSADDGDRVQRRVVDEVEMQEPRNVVAEKAARHQGSRYSCSCRSRRRPSARPWRCRRYRRPPRKTA